MATIIVVLDRDLRPIAEINTVDLALGDGSLVIRGHGGYRMIQQPMLDPAPEQPTLWHVYEDE